VHAAAVPGPSFGTEEEIQRVNVDGTANVAAAAARVHATRIVFISSESVLGFVFSEGAVKPSYLPVDEAHPLAPAEPYGRSKLQAELALARSAGETTSVVCLRPPWVWLPEEYEKLRELTMNPSEWWDGIWAYVHGDDLAEAVELAATREIEPGVHAAYVAAPDNGTVVPTARLVDEYYPDVPVRGDLPEFGSLLSSDRLQALLGFRPSMSWRDFLK
jgi:nucleoside-diphosphate-sugar epimerase